MKNNNQQPKNPTQLGWYVSKITKSFYNKQGFAQNHIMENWKTIVGSKFFNNSMPIKLNIKKTGGILTIACDGGVALELEYLKQEIISNVNSYYGFNAVNKIQFKNLPLDIENNQKQQETTPQSDVKDSFSKDESELLSQKGDSALEKALFKLEKTVLKRKNEL